MRFSDRPWKGNEVSAGWKVIWLAFKSHEHGECPPPMCRLGRVLPAQYWRGEAYQRPELDYCMMIQRPAARSLIALPRLLEGRIGGKGWIQSIHGTILSSSFFVPTSVEVGSVGK